MTKTEFSKEIARNCSLTNAQVKDCLSAFEKVLKEQIASGEPLRFAGLKLSVVPTPEREGFNPLKGERITIPASKRLVIKAAPGLKKIAKYGTVDVATTEEDE